MHMNQNTAELKSALMQRGAIVLNEEDGILSKEDWDEIEAMVQPGGLSYETVLIGDAGEPNQVQVGRFMTDVRNTKVVNEELNAKLMKIITSERMKTFYRDLVGMDVAHIRRAQVNKMLPGSFIGLHLDRDSNPDYEVSIVLQLGREFGGGEFVVHDRNGPVQSIAPTYRSMTVSHCSFPHEVKRVTAGERISLVYFLCEHAQDNRRLSSSQAGAMEQTAQAM